MIRAFLLCPALFLIAECGAGCGGKKDISKAEAAVTQFHAQLNSGNFDQIYSDSDTLMKNATTQEKLTNLLGAVHRKLGAAHSADRRGFFVNYSTNGEVVRLTYSTQFDNDKASEEFVFRVDGSNVRLAGYHINADALITQ